MLPFYTNCSSIDRGIFILSSARCEQARQASSEKHYDIDRRRSSKKYQTQVATSKVQATAPHNCRLGETSSALCGSIGHGLPTGSLPSLRLSSRTQPVDGTEVLRRLLTMFQEQLHTRTARSPAAKLIWNLRRIQHCCCVHPIRTLGCPNQLLGFSFVPSVGSISCLL